MLPSKLIILGICAVTCLTSVTSAQRARSSVVIGQSLVDVKNPQPGQLHSPFGVDFDRAGNMYIVELEGGRVHQMGPDGKFETIAGNETKGYTGDGGPASKATFNGMHNVAVTPEGDIYISDSWNHCIRKIDGKTKTISTIAGTGEPGFSGDGGQASKATFNFLMCITFNAAYDKIYVADLKNLRIRVIDLGTGTISTVAGNGKKGVPQDGDVATESPLVDPRAVTVDSQGNVYILERSGNALRVVTPNGRIRTVAGTGKKGSADGPALQAEFNSPKHVAIDLDDNVIIADDQNRAIRKYDAKKQTLTSILGAGVEKPRRGLSRPHGVCVHEDGSLYIVDTGHHRILKLKLQ